MLIPTAQGQDFNNSMNILYIDQSHALLLPSFDTASVLGSSIDSITLSMYVLDINQKDKVPTIHVTINPFDQSTKQADNGLSNFIPTPDKKGYMDIILPRELFETIIGTNKRFLVKMVSSDTNIVLAGVNDAITDPRLTIVHSDDLPQKEPESPVVINYIFESINNSQIIIGDKTNNASVTNRNTREGLATKLLWYFIVPILVGLVLYYIFKVK